MRITQSYQIYDSSTANLDVLASFLRQKYMIRRFFFTLNRICSGFYLKTTDVAHLGAKYLITRPQYNLLDNDQSVRRIAI